MSLVNGPQRSVCLYFGSFNPIHNGHIALARYVVGDGLADEVWVVVSPQNPLKSCVDLADDKLRLRMAELAFAEDIYIKVSTVEFDMPKPSFTIDTLNLLQSKYPHCQFSILLGQDNIATFDQWKNYQQILDRFTILVYPRSSCVKNRMAFQNDFLQHKNIVHIKAPIIDISSTQIRQSIFQSRSVCGLMPTSVINFIQKKRLYR